MIPFDRGELEVMSFEEGKVRSFEEKMKRLEEVLEKVME